MDNYVWRFRARVVAYVDLVLTSLSLLAVLVGTLALGYATTYVATHPNEMIDNGKKLDTAMVWYIWLVVALLAVFTGLQLWAALKLLSATEVGRVAYEALDKARIWRNVTIVFLVFQVVTDLLVWGPISLVVNLLWRGGLLFVVYNFIKELEITVTSTGGSASATTVIGNNFPDEILVK